MTGVAAAEVVLEVDEDHSDPIHRQREQVAGLCSHAVYFPTAVLAVDGPAMPQPAVP